MIRRASVPVGIAAAFIVAGCSSGTDAPEQSDEKPAASATEVADAEARAPAFTSTYTELDFDDCDLLSENREEGSSATFRCPGLGNTALFVQEGDGRFDLDAGIDDDGFQTLAAFNDIAQTVEWRLRGDMPVAVIFRYEDATIEDAGRTVLAVERVGEVGAPGCRIAHVAGDTPKANERARVIADERAANYDCAGSDIEYIGNAR